MATYFTASHYITFHNATLHHITSHHIISYHITIHHITSHHITSHHTTSHHIVAGLGDNMQSDSDEWQSWFNSEMPEHSKLPGEHQATLSTFDRLILLRVMRPDRVTTALKSWIEEAMGKEYVTQKPFDMALTYKETSCHTPIFFVLFAGVRDDALACYFLPLFFYLLLHLSVCPTLSCHALPHAFTSIHQIN